MSAEVVVVGSIGMDLIFRAPRLPRVAETLLGRSFATAAGGKGGNQAVAAARLGAKVAMVACMRKLLLILNAILKTQQPWRSPAVEMPIALPA